MENETKEVIKMQKLKKTQQNKQLTFETYEHALFSDPDGVTNENKSNEMKWDFTWQTNVNANSWCKNVLLTRFGRRNHQNNRKKLKVEMKIVSAVAHKIRQITYGIFIFSIIAEVMTI